MHVYYQSPIGLISIKASEQGIFRLNFSDQKPVSSCSKSPISNYLSECVAQLETYFKGKLKYFDIPVDLNSQGSPFRRAVWKQLSLIDYGKTMSYKELAAKVKSPKAYRAVGSANGSNPISIIIPCHRVIQHNGYIGGYGGQVWRKKWLLEHEKKYTSSL